MDSTRLIAKAGTPEWFQARRFGVSATTVAKAAGGYKGFSTELQKALHPEEHVLEDNDFMRFGRDMEKPIIDALPMDMIHNEWLVASESNEHHLATPDGHNHDWSTICEVKTTGRDFDEGGIPAQYRRQVQWQLYVTGAQECVFAWMLRVDTPQGFAPGWLEPKWTIMRRSETEIARLITVANQFLKDYEFTREWEAQLGYDHTKTWKADTEPMKEQEIIRG